MLTRGVVALTRVDFVRDDAGAPGAAQLINADGDVALTTVGAAAVALNFTVARTDFCLAARNSTLRSLASFGGGNSSNTTDGDGAYVGPTASSGTALLCRSGLDDNGGCAAPVSATVHAVAPAGGVYVSSFPNVTTWSQPSADDEAAVAADAVERARAVPSLLAGESMATPHFDAFGEVRRAFFSLW